MELNIILNDIQSSINTDDNKTVLDNLEQLEDKLGHLKNISNSFAERITNLILKLFLSNNSKLYSQGLLFLNSYQKYILNLYKLNESKFENVIRIHEEGQLGIITSNCLIDIYNLILKFHLQDDNNLIKQFKNDILKGFVIDSNIEKEKLISWLIRCSTIFENFPVDFFTLPVVACLNNSVKSLQELSKNFLVTNYILKKSDKDKNSFKNKVKEECEKLKIKPLIYEEILEKMDCPVENKTKSNIGSKKAIPISSIFIIPGTIPSYTVPNEIELSNISDIDNEVNIFCKVFSGKETEDNWDQRNKAIQKFRGIFNENNVILNNNIKLLKPAIDLILDSIQSLRTALCVTSCLSIIDLATFYKTQLDVYSDIIISKLMPLINQTNKVISTLSSHTLGCIIKNVSYNLRNLQIISIPIIEKHKNTNTRQISTILIGISIEIAIQNDIQKEKFEKFGGLDLVISCLKKSIQDAGQFIRETSRKIFSIINVYWKVKATKFMDSLDMTTRKNLIKYIEKNPTIPSSSNKIQALKKKNKPVNLLKKKKKLENTTLKSYNNKLNIDSQIVDFNFTALTSEQQKHCNTTPSREKKSKPIIGLKRSYSTISDNKNEIDEEDNAIINTPSKLPRLKSLSERKKARYNKEIRNEIEDEENSLNSEDSPIKAIKNLFFNGNENEEIQLVEKNKEILKTPTKKSKSIKDKGINNHISNENDSNYIIKNNENDANDRNKKFTTPKVMQKTNIINIESDNNNSNNNNNSNSNETINNSVTLSKHQVISTPSKLNRIKKVENTPHKPLKEVKNENSKIIAPKSNSKKQKHSNAIPNSPSLATPYLFKQNLIKKFKEIDNLKIRIEALKELLEYFRTSKVNKIGPSLQINEGIMSFLNDGSDEILNEILDEQTLDILLKARVISIEQLIPKIIDIEIKINKQKKPLNNDDNENNDEDNNEINQQTNSFKNAIIYSEFAINKVNHIINWIKQEKFTVPIMRNIIVELIAKNGKSRKKYNNVNEILECLLEWIIELLINDMSENIFYINAKSEKEAENDFKIGKRNPCSIILLLGNWISTTFGNEINGRSLISFLWCIKKLNNKTLKYIKEYFSEEIYNQLIKGIEILDNEFEKSKETILYDNSKTENNKQNNNTENNIPDNEDKNESKENTSQKSTTYDNIITIDRGDEKQKSIMVEENKIKDNESNYKLIKEENKARLKENNKENQFEFNISKKDSNKYLNSKYINNNAQEQSISISTLIRDNNKSISYIDNTLINDLMEVDEQYTMLPEENYVSKLSNNNQNINEHSFIIHGNANLSDTIEVEKIDSKIDLDNYVHSKKDIKSEFSEINNIEVKKEQINDKEIVEGNPLKKAKLNSNLSKSIIIIENSSILFEEENPKRKRIKTEDNSSIILLDDDKSSIKKNIVKKENEIIYIDSSYSKNDINVINNDKQVTEKENNINLINNNKHVIEKENNIKNVINNDKHVIEKENILPQNEKDANIIINDDNDHDQDTPRNNFEIYINEYDQGSLNNNHNSNDNNDNDNTINMDICKNNNEKLKDNNLELDENVLLSADNINKNERRTSIITPVSSKIRYINLDFINNNYCKYKKPLGIERLFIKETPNAKYFSANIDQDLLFSNLYNSLKSSKPNESVFRNLIRLSNIEKDKNITTEKLNKVNELWNTWFERIYLVLIQKLQTFDNNNDEQEYILLLLQNLMKNQAMYFKGKENGLFCLINQFMNKKSEELYITTENTLKVYAQYLDKVSCLKSILSYLNRQFSFNIDSNSFYDQNLKFSYRSTSESFAFENLSQVIARFNQQELQEYLNDIQNILSKGLSCTLTDIRRTVIDCCLCIHKILNNESWLIFLNKFTIVNQVLIKIFVDQLEK
ncbi:hypothetical protein BCR32DRAFT_271312 [Anaeromyces robustus]|uniref:CLASP N-terminal domain-containing protein n=1 Tax=Anaeromyces robustus TaxID=1754192 RepID=A0A1Y1WS48_9FUNG|nr:hypothetical protein BCR32DRAFT_271312 [Anaeromyces robustus]|eukprot:ORX76370.1 hypothetical protein BCR32DRAFT_271312 [Anaeromyces robustus]